jgi:hypothetical protein
MPSSDRWLVVEGEYRTFREAHPNKKTPRAGLQVKQACLGLYPNAGSICFDTN